MATPAPCPNRSLDDALGASCRAGVMMRGVPLTVNMKVVCTLPAFASATLAGSTYSGVCYNAAVARVDDREERDDRRQTIDD